MSDSETELLVGVKTNPDGSKDYSRALRMHKESSISDPIVDRLRGSIVVDYEKEDKYRSLEKRMSEMAESGELVTWFAGMLNKIKEPNSPEITVDDLQDLKFVTDSPEITTIKQQYGRDYKRGYFSVQPGSYSTVYNKLTGTNGSAGCIIHSDRFSSDPDVATVGITLVPGIQLSNDIVHEMGHTIDPYLGKRNPQDSLLEEFGTYYRDTYIPSIVTSTSRQKSENGTWSEPVVTKREIYEKLPRINNNLKNNYYDTYGSAFATKEDYEKQVDSVTSILVELEGYMAKPDINRAIFNAKSVYELQHLLDVVKQEKGEGL